MAEYSFEDLVGAKPKKEEGFSFEELVGSKPATEASINLNTLVSNPPFASGSGDPEAPPLIARPEYVNRWPETSYLRTPESGYTAGLADGQEVIVSTDGKNQQLARWNAKSGNFEFDSTEVVQGYRPNPSAGTGMGSMPYYTPPQRVQRINSISPDSVVGYTNAADKIDTAKVAFGRSIIPTTAGFAGFGGGLGLGAALAPATGFASLAIPLITGATGGFFGGMGGQALQDKMFPIDKEQQLALDSNPNTAGVASFAPAFIAAPANPRTYLNLASKAPGVAAGAARQIGSNTAMMGALGTGNDIGANLMAGRPAFEGVGLGSVLHHGATGLALGHPNVIGRTMEAPGRLVANAALKPFNRGAFAAPRANTTADDIAAAAEQVAAEEQTTQQPAPAAEAPAPVAEAPAPAKETATTEVTPPARAPAHPGSEATLADRKAWFEQYGKTHFLDGSPRPPEYIEGTPEYAARKEQEAAKPATPDVTNVPQGNVEPRPSYDKRFSGRGQQGIDEYTAAWKAWDAKYKDTHYSDGTPKKPVSAASPTPAAAQPEANPAPAAQPAPVAKETAPSATEKPSQTILDKEIAGLNERIRFIKGELIRRQAEAEADAKSGRTNPELGRRIDRLKGSLADAEGSLESLKDRNAPRSELPKPKPEPTTAEVLAKRKQELDTINRQLEAAYRRNADGETLARLEAEQERISNDYEDARIAAEQEQQTAPSEPAKVPAREQTPAQPPVQQSNVPAREQAPAAPAANPKAEPQGIKEARAQLAKLEASGNGASNQARARRKYIRAWEKDNGLPYSVELEAPKPEKAPAAPAEKPVAQTPVEPVAVEPAPAPTAEATKATFDRPKLERISTGLDSVENYRQNQQPRKSAEGRLKNLIKQLDDMFPGIVERVTSDEFIKRYDLPSREVLASEPHEMAKALMREVRGKLFPEVTAQMDRAMGRDVQTNEKPEAPKQPEAPKPVDPTTAAEEAPFDPASSKPDPRENPKDVAEREALFQQENPADTTEPTAKEVEANTARNIIRGLEEQIAKAEKGGRGDSKQTKKQRAALERAKEKLAELEGKTDEPVAQAEPAPAEAASTEAPKEKPAPTPEREAKITAILDLAEATDQTHTYGVREVIEEKGSDGKWYGIGGHPNGVKLTGEKRSAGWIMTTQYGIGIGKRYPTEAAAREAMGASRKGNREEFRKSLEQADNETLDDKLEFWNREKGAFDRRNPEAAASRDMAPAAEKPKTAEIPAEKPTSIEAPAEKPNFREKKASGEDPKAEGKKRLASVEGEGVLRLDAEGNVEIVTPEWRVTHDPETGTWKSKSISRSEYDIISKKGVLERNKAVEDVVAQRERDAEAARDEQQARLRQEQNARTQNQNWRSEVNANAAKGKKGNIDVQVSRDNGKTYNTESRPATIYGDWAVSGSGNNYDVHHIGTGLRIRGNLNREQANTLVRGLIHGGVNGKFTDVSAGGEANKVKIKDILLATVNGDKAPEYWKNKAPEAQKAPDSNAVPESPEATIEAVQRIAGSKLSKGAREELAIRSEEGLQPDFIDEGNIKSLKDHLNDLVERLETTIDASRDDPYEGPKARKNATEAKKAVEAAIAKLESEGAQPPKADTIAAERQVEAINDKLAELERQKKGESPEAEALRQQRDKLQATIDAQTPESADVRSKAEKWADDTIAEGKKRLNTGIDPELIAAYAVKGAIKFARSLKDFKEFSSEMVKEFGDGIKPHIKAIFDKAQEPGLAKEYAEQQEARAKAGQPEPDLAKEAATLGEQRAKEREQSRQMAQGQKPELSAGGRTWRSVVDHPIVAWFKPLSMRMRTVADLNPQSETAQKVVNDFSLIPGTKETGPDFNTESANQRNIFFNKVTQALGPVLADIRRMTPDQRAKFNDIFIRAIEGRLPTEIPGETGQAVKRVKAVLDELHQYGINAGLDMGKVTDYFPRQINADAVQADRAAFEEAAAKAYERQWERQQKEALEGQTEFGFADGQTQRPDFKAMARKWADAIILGHEGLDFERSIFEEGNPATKENWQKSREFTKEEAAEFDAFRDKDFETVLTRHVGGAVRRAEIARRLGADGGKWSELASQMSKEGVSAEHIAELKDTIQSNLGVSGNRLGNKTAGALDVYNLVTTAAYLKATGLLNLGEAASFGLRRGDPVSAATAVFQNAARVRNVLTRLTPEQSKAMKTEIERVYGKGHDLASALAIELGINQINHGLGSVSAGYHLDGGSDRTGAIRQRSDNVYRMFGIHATEVAKRETSLVEGMKFIDKTVQFIDGNSNLQRVFKAIGKDVRADTLAKDRLMELGVKSDNVEAVSQFARELRGLDGDAQLKKIMADDPVAAEYRKALTLFNKQSSVQATRASRTQVANDTPFGKLLFQFSTFTNEWSAQHGRYMAETAKKVLKNPGERYTPTERLLAAGSAPAYAMAVGAMAGIKGIINTLTGFDYNDERAPAWLKAGADAVVYTGILGPAEMLYKAAIREQVPLGVLGDWLKNGLQVYGRLKENPDSNAAQRSATKMGYRSGVVPAVVGGLATVAPNPVTAVAAQVVANNRVENLIADEVSGADEAKGGSRQPKIPSPPRPPSR